MLKGKRDGAARRAVLPVSDRLPTTPETAPSRMLAGASWRAILLPAALLLAAAAALSIDCPLAGWCMGSTFPEWLREVSTLCEPFGHGLGVLIILLAIHQLDPARRYALARVTACSLGAGLTANVVKLAVGRVRPYHFGFEGGVWATFDGWLPLLSAGSAGQSFPSAHTATAVGLAVALTWLYPCGRVLFPTLAALVACQRLQGGAHYLSDVCCGAAVGIVVAGMCLGAGRLGAQFDRLERWWQTRPSRSPRSADVALPETIHLPGRKRQGDQRPRRAA